MSDLVTLLFGNPASLASKSDDDARLKLLFGRTPPMFDRGDLSAIAERVFQRAADYVSDTPTAKNRKALASRIEKFVAEIDQPHPVTLRPMIEHRHFVPELSRLLHLLRDIRAAISKGVVDESLKAELRMRARESTLASTAAKTTQREKQADWIGPVIDRANELMRQNPKRKTSGIALEIAQDATANPKGKSSETIRKLLNESKLS